MATKVNKKTPAKKTTKKKPTSKKVVSTQVAPPLPNNKLARWVVVNPILVVVALVLVVGASAGYAYHRNVKTMANCTTSTAKTSTPGSSTSGLSVTKTPQQSLGDTTESDFMNNPTAPAEAGSKLQQNAATLNQAPTSTLQAPTGTGGLDPSQF